MKLMRKIEFIFMQTRQAHLWRDRELRIQGREIEAHNLSFNEPRASRKKRKVGEGSLNSQTGA